MDCNISIVFTSRIREKLEAIIEVRRRHLQQLSREATEVEGEKGGETRPNEKRGDVEDIDHGNWVIVQGSSYGTRAEVTMTSTHARGVRSGFELSVCAFKSLTRFAYHRRRSTEGSDV